MIDAIAKVNTDINFRFNNLELKLKNENNSSIDEGDSISLANKNLKSSSKKSKQEINKVDYRELEIEVRKLLKENNVQMDFSIDDQSKKIVLKIIDEKSKEVVNQIPTELSLHISKIISRFIEQGTITNAKV